jgi:hypothetical protein
MTQTTERRAARRFTMVLPLIVRGNSPEGQGDRQGKTRDVGFKGVYFTTDAEFEPGKPIEFILTLPSEITLANDVHIHCLAEVVRVEPRDGHKGVAARIDNYEFLPLAS